MIEEEKIKAHCHKFNFKNQIPLKSRKKMGATAGK